MQFAKIEPGIDYYRRQIESYNNTAHHILKNKIDIILPQLPTKHKCGIITTLVSSIIGLAHEIISSFLHNRRHKALHKAVKAMASKRTIHCNKLMHFKDSMVMYRIYNAETLEQIIIAFTILHHLMKKLFAGQQSAVTLQSLYANVQGIQHYSINSLLHLRAVRDKYVLLYKELIAQLHIYATTIRILAKGYLPISLITPLKLKEVLNKVRNTFKKTNPDYDLVIKRLHLYYDMKLVTFGIDNNKNLDPAISNFHTALHTAATDDVSNRNIPVPIIDKNTQAHSYTYLQIDRPYIALNSETYITIRQQVLMTCKRIGCEFYCEELFIVKHKSKYSCKSAIYFNINPEIIKGKLQI